jgi:hypothetical protein
MLWTRLTNIRLIYSDPDTFMERHLQTHVSRLAVTSPHLLADIGLTDAEAEARVHEATPRPDGGLQGRHF